MFVDMDSNQHLINLYFKDVGDWEAFIRMQLIGRLGVAYMGDCLALGRVGNC